MTLMVVSLLMDRSPGSRATIYLEYIYTKISMLSMQYVWKLVNAIKKSGGVVVG